MQHAICLFLVTCLANGFCWADAEGKISFTDVTEAAGLRFQHVDGRSGQRYFLETVGSGAAFFDYDADGLLDIYLVNSADLPGSHSSTPPTNQLYHNNGDGTFTDVTEQAGVGDTGYGAGCAAADYDNDGDQDLYVTNFGANLLYRNNGDGTFTDVTDHAGVGDSRWSLGCAFADYDKDGFVDLYVANYIDFDFETHTNCTQKGVATYCPPESFKGSPDTLYRNNGDGTFTDVTTSTGVYNEDGKGMGSYSGITTTMAMQIVMSAMMPGRISSIRTRVMAPLQMWVGWQAWRLMKMGTYKEQWGSILEIMTMMDA